MGYAKSLPPPPGLLLIDVQQNRLIHATVSLQYFALSYVWGGPQQSETTSQNVEARLRLGGLANVIDDLPRTLQDAISLTRMVGERYLWVDSMCIAQDDQTGAKPAQIEAMADIYAGASATIIAGYGDNARAGLPGVGTARIRVSQQATVCGIDLATYYDVGRVLLNSKWSSRAWTFQEQHLARRCLIFTEEGAMLSAGRERWEESKYGSTVRVKSDFGLHADDGTDRRVVYARSVGLYTARELSEPTDILNAYQGLLRVMKQRFFHSPYVHGLPISEIDFALQWTLSSIRSTPYGFVRRSGKDATQASCGVDGVQSNSNVEAAPFVLTNLGGLPVEVMLASFGYEAELRSVKPHTGGFVRSGELIFLHDARGHPVGHIRASCSTISPGQDDHRCECIAMSRVRNNSRHPEEYDPDLGHDLWDVTQQSECDMSAYQGGDKCDVYPLIDRWSCQWLDTETYDATKLWCRYSVMLISRRPDPDGGPDLASRVGLGVCHIDGFLSADPKWTRLQLV